MITIIMSTQESLREQRPLMSCHLSMEESGNCLCGRLISKSRKLMPAVQGAPLIPSSPVRGFKRPEVDARSFCDAKVLQIEIIFKQPLLLIHKAVVCPNMFPRLSVE